MRRISIFWLLLVASCGNLFAQSSTSASLSLKNTIPLDGVEGRIDHMAIDSVAKRLYVAALGNNTVEVIDLAAGKRIKQISGLEEPQGIRVLPESGTVVIASGGDGKCRFYDRDFNLLATIDDLPDADNVRYDATAKLVYVGYGNGALAVVDPANHKKVGDIRLQAHPESFQLEKKGNRIFVNVPGARQIAVIDRTKRELLSTWPVKDAAANFPMALDEADHRLFVCCRQPAKLLVLDTETGTVLASLDCSGDADDLFYDQAMGELLVSGGQGMISVVERQNGDHYTMKNTIKTASGARTSVFDSEARLLYLAVPHRGDQKAAIGVYRIKAMK